MVLQCCRNFNKLHCSNKRYKHKKIVLTVFFTCGNLRVIVTIFEWKDLVRNGFRFLCGSSGRHIVVTLLSYHGVGTNNFYNESDKTYILNQRKYYKSFNTRQANEIVNRDHIKGCPRPTGPWIFKSLSRSRAFVRTKN